MNPVLHNETLNQNWPRSRKKSLAALNAQDEIRRASRSTAAASRTGTDDCIPNSAACAKQKLRQCIQIGELIAIWGRLSTTIRASVIILHSAGGHSFASNPDMMLFDDSTSALVELQPASNFLEQNECRLPC
jgi:hypothetical protein